METITALHRNHFGQIISFVTSEGRVISYQKALDEAENGLIYGVETGLDMEGNIYLKPEDQTNFDEYPDIF
ncbi:DUF3892 domain-containing protein [Neobacillus mesonae]|uniref:DUF3892 domain-containing protein n=1 Tax=Neobacillus mesonae TaxID=1193713 RepID=UPI00203E57DE|nr:DUF3892 domain-containing protein [Neobacillus mesonae]MCM3566865.1 DUF3892 domain-containing protein [Neobacillus mesonae]